MQSENILENINLVSLFLKLDISYFFNNHLIYKTPTTLVYPSFLNSIILNDFSLNFSSSFHVFKNNFFTYYIFYKVENENYLIIGPFLKESHRNSDLSDFMKNNKISNSDKKILFKYIYDLQIIDKLKLDNIKKFLDKFFYKSNYSSENLNKDSDISSKFNTFYEKNILFYEKLLAIRSPISLELELIKNVEKGNVDESIYILNQINLLYKASLSTSLLQSRKYSLVSMCTLLTRSLINVNINYVQAFAFSDAIINEIDKLSTIENADSYEKYMIEHFCILIKNKKHNKYSTCIKLSIDFIYENLYNKISIAQISNYVHITPNHLCKVFKNETGKTIINFINQKKIEESVLLLENTNKTIIEISNLYNFCNESYFVSLFKKYIGVTPKQFKIQKKKITKI